MTLTNERMGNDYDVDQPFCDEYIGTRLIFPHHNKLTHKYIKY
jgi:hypothetical protein